MMRPMEQDVSRQESVARFDNGFEETNGAVVRMNRCLHELVGDHPDFEVLCEPTGAPYYFRYVPNTLADRLEEVQIQQLVNRLNEEIVENVQCRGFKSVTTINVRGLVAIQISISSNEIPHTTFEALARWGRLLHTTHQAAPNREKELC
ncbi:MAG TPA: hypothetical protein VF251_06840 [Pyrinomonadaceae bacterium]